MNRARNVALLVLAAGSGTRFQHVTPKQYHILSREPLFVHAIRPFLSTCRATLKQVVIACPESFMALTKRQSERYLPADVPTSIIVGGRRRIDTIFSSIEYALRDKQIKTLFVHDAARPLTHPDDIRGLMRAFSKGRWDAGVLGKPLSESLFMKSGAHLKGMNREEYCFGETPFVYTRNVAEDMLERWEKKTGTFHTTLDLTELLSRSGHYRIGSYEAKHPNIKLTYPVDALIIRRYAQSRSRARDS
jgi:2-C-methyl-D-erythritol 4-phosphate cytidylyltransferase